ncbi:erythrocyte band 7 integral membrane protein-like isoform X2 [Archocentrus centrarchus]|nr:erythrocyte band 7 integral membrane protein-like isoform X2 [Archocentrus centrarchus]XP_030612251.1 erythrocyte band 7 integral membrane protein-like isoform X2 [Archocentrus centrarchus]
MVVEVLGKVLTLFSVVLIFLTFPISVWMCAKVIQEYERAVVFRLGRVTEGPARGPGLLWVIPWLDSIQKVDLRSVSIHIQPQEVLTADAVPLKVDAVVFFRVVNPFMWVMHVKNGPQAICLLAQTILKTAIGAHTLADLLTQKLAIRKRMEMVLHDASKPWGAQVERVELKAMMLPVDLQRCMASEAEALRRARAKMIAATGEVTASHALMEAASTFEGSSVALHLKFLHSLFSVQSSVQSIVVLPIPIELLDIMISQVP